MFNKTYSLTNDGTISQYKSNNEEVIMPVTIDPLNAKTEESTDSDMPTGTLAAIAMGGGGAIGGVGGGVIGGAVGGAFLGVATGGIGLLVGGIVGGIVTLSIWLSQKGVNSI